ncbi:hypothetical protein [Edaphobacter albus]|uniref:hypothetical protein n=1 Tax=Edaphobacter sp. 4G125 TaxID=2763071 RepID=UPI001645859E|nr:hypothetical protein [Edaphobacter sp. 4G125]QNI36977.1 hypothetical protein H7846_01140 [Edaphobacter sp. 4G125]
MKNFNEQSAVQFLKDVRRPLLTLHKSILDHERAAYEKTVGPITPAAFLQELISGTNFRWIAPLTTAITSIDELLDEKETTDEEKVAGAQAISALFAPDAPDNAFRQRYLTLLQESPAILHEHSKVIQALNNVG